MAPTSPSAHGAPKKPAWKNHRATVRYRCALATPGKVYIPEDVEYQRVWIHDLSASGIGLIIATPFDIGVHITIQIKTAIQKVYDLPARVVHSTQQSGGDWIIGCRFVEALSGDALDDLLL